MDRFSLFRKLRLLCFCVLLGCTGKAQKTVELVVKDYPAKQGSDIFIAGAFNGWDPSKTKLEYDEMNRLYKTTIALQKGDKAEYKFTRGSWATVEANGDGTEIQNRVLNLLKDSDTLKIAAWKDDFDTQKVASTATENVVVLDSLYMPQLKRSRIIRLYLPDGYATNKKRYPVIYMHDGQNLFDAATAAYGEWNVDETIRKFSQQCIVVGIDNGPRRINEYNPYHNKRFGSGEGTLYARFLVETLKPYIDKNYRTLKDKQNTSVCGSSMGGLISMYAILKYPNVFGSAGVFSPSFWLTPKIYTMMKGAGKPFNNRIYLYAGDAESAGLVNEINRSEKTLLTNTTASVTRKIAKGAGHNEKAWSAVFPEFYRWLLRR